MKSLRTLLTNLPFIVLAAWLGACSSSDSGTPAPTLTEINEVWYGPARLQQCDQDIKMASMFPGLTWQSGEELLYPRAFTAAKATFKRTIHADRTETLALQAIYYDGAVFFDLEDADSTNDEFAPTALTAVDPPPPPQYLFHLEFGNVPEVTVEDLTLPVVEGGGLVMSEEGAHAFLYIHDKSGCDLVIAAIQRTTEDQNGVEPLPIYSEADFMDTAWSGISEEFLDESGGALPTVITWNDEPSWTLNVGISTTSDVTGSGSDKKTPVTFIGGYILPEDPTDPNGFFSGMLFTETEDNWVIRGFLTPDKAYFGGFAWKDALQPYWHDLSLLKQ